MALTKFTEKLISDSFKTTISGSDTAESSSFASRVTLVEAGSTSKTLVSSSVLSSPSQGTIRLATNGVNTDVDSGLQVGDSPTFAGGTITGDLAVGGTLTAQEVHTEFESASILFTSGSTQFGNSSDDVHEFKGNTISGSVTSTGSFGSAHFMGTGGVGIGTNNPSYKLDIIENAETNVVRFFNDGGDQNRDVMILQGGSDSGPGNTRFITFNDGNGDAFGFIQGPADSATAGISFNTTADTSLLTLKGSLVGIGTNDPNEKLHVEGSSPSIRIKASNEGGEPELKLQSDQGDDHDDLFSIRAVASHALNILNFTGDTGTSVLFISGSGHVKVPQGTLEVGDHGVAGGKIVSDGDLSIHAGFNDSSTGNGDIIFKRFGESATAVELVRVASTGRLGVGNVSSPSEPLHVSGSDSGIRIEARSGARGTLSFVNSSGTVEGKISSRGTGDLRIGGGSSANDDIIIADDGVVTFANTIKPDQSSTSNQSSVAFQTVDGNDHGGVKISHGDGGKIELFGSNQSRTQFYANVITANVNGLEIKTTDSQHLVFGSNNTTRMTVRSEGHIQVREWTDAFGQINIQAGHVLADNAEINIVPKGNTYAALVLAQDASSGQGAMFFHSYAATMQEISDPSGVFTVTDDNDGTINVVSAVNTKNLTIENKRGDSRQVGFCMYALEAE